MYLLRMTKLRWGTPAVCHKLPLPVVPEAKPFTLSQPMFVVWGSGSLLLFQLSRMPPQNSPQGPWDPAPLWLGCYLSI